MQQTEPILLKPVASNSPVALEEATTAFITELEAKNRSRARYTRTLWTGSMKKAAYPSG